MADPAGVHPCLRCGACCASFRVAFHWSEAGPENPRGVPPDLCLPLRRHEREMRLAVGHEPMRCIALEGELGRAVACRIYERRPSPCRELRASFEDGRRDDQCDRARRRHGMVPLGPQDWSPVRAG